MCSIQGANHAVIRPKGMSWLQSCDKKIIWSVHIFMILFMTVYKILEKLKRKVLNNNDQKSIVQTTCDFLKK